MTKNSNSPHTNASTAKPNALKLLQSTSPARATQSPLATRAAVSKAEDCKRIGQDNPFVQFMTQCARSVDEEIRAILEL